MQNIIPTPCVGSVVAYYAERSGEQIRQPITATVEATYPLTEVSFARVPAQQYCNAVDLVYFVGSELHRATRIAYAADATGAGSDECWAWPQVTASDAPAQR